MARFSTGERKKRSKGDRRSIEISLIIQQIFQDTIMTELSPRSQIDIFITVLQADGGTWKKVGYLLIGTRCAGINAATLEVIDAGIPIRDFAVACAAGCYEGTPLMGIVFG